MTISRRRLPCWLALVLLIAVAPAAARAQIPADARWRTYDTQHFRVHFTEGLDSVADRAGARAEAAYGEISRALVRPPSGRIDLLVTDNVDYANGFATPFPRNRVVIFAHPPIDEPSLAFYDDWLDLVITHELVHVFHLDHASGLPRALRTVFGRIPMSFPNPSIPRWTVEGMATWLESRLTSAGRVRGTMHEMALRTAVLEDRFFSLPRASGDPVSWPSGNTSYVYGSMFLDWMARRHGDEAAGEFVRIYGARVIPFLTDRAARSAYDQSFTSGWREWRGELETRYARLADSLRAGGITEPEMLTAAGRMTRFPRWSPDGRWIAYAAATGREEPSTRVVGMDGRVRVLASRTTVAPVSWRADGGSLVTSMIEVARPDRYFSDLYEVDADGGDRRLTRSARLVDVDVARDGRLVAVRSAPGTNHPVVLASADAEPVALARPSLDVQWASPRWSPDGRRIAISRWRRGGRYDVVVLDAASGAVVAEATDDRAVDMTPAWSPDGRYVLFSSDRTGIANLYAFEVETRRLAQVTSVLTGAFEPDVSPDGRWIAFSWYRADGYHVARIPFDPATWRAAPPVRAEALGEESEVPGERPAVTRPVRPYSAWRTIAPTWWQPTALDGDELGVAIGAVTGGEDVAERHQYGAYAQVYTDRGRVDAGAGYTFRGLGNPTIGASVFQDWDVLAEANTIGGAEQGSTIPTALLERERSASLVATFARPRFRSYSWLSAGVNVRDRERPFDDPELASGIAVEDPPADVGAVASLGYSTVRSYDYSVSAENGFVAAIQAEGRRFTRVLEGDEEKRGYARLAGRTQLYRGFRAWGFARHVLALRVAGGGDAGSRSPGLFAGGYGGFGSAFPLGTGTNLGDDLELPVRGYAEGSQVGDRGVGATAEWRFPIALVERGIGLVPVYLDRVWGTAFADAGTAWCVETCDPVFRPFTAARPLYSVGTELGADVLLGFNLRMRLRGGVALPLRDLLDAEGNRRARPPAELYFTFGQSF